VRSSTWPTVTEVEFTPGDGAPEEAAVVEEPAPDVVVVVEEAAGGVLDEQALAIRATTAPATRIDALGARRARAGRAVAIGWVRLEKFTLPLWSHLSQVPPRRPSACHTRARTGSSPG